MRLFVAIDLPRGLAADLRSCAEGALDRCRDARLTRMENIHITVRFLGNVDDGSVTAATDALRAAVAPLPPFPMAFDGLRFAPRGAPRMLWASFARSEAFERVVRSCGNAAAPFMEEDLPDREPSPHATLARFKEASCAAGGDPPCRPADPAFDVAACTLYSSALAPDGPTYRAVADLPLAI